MHIIDETTCSDYFEDRLSPVERAAFNDHLAACGECREFYARMERTEYLLNLARQETAAKVLVDREQIAVNLARTLAVVIGSEGRDSVSSKSDLARRLDQITVILASMCGSWTAVNALRVSAEATKARTPEELTTENWAPFLKHLKKLASLFCGDAGAKLVWEYGRL